jgi:hypothetical protein
MSNPYADLVAGSVGSLGQAQILGEMEILGAMSDEDIRRLQLARSIGGKVVQPKVYSKMRVQPAGFPATVVGAGATVDIPIRPQRLFQVHAISIGSTQNGFWTINQISVGQDNQLLVAGPIQCEYFSEVADGRRHILQLDEGNVGNELILNVTNLTAGQLTFRAAITAVAFR